MDWPEQLIDQIVRDRWCLFIGSGVAASCQNKAGERPPSWSGLLATLCGSLNDADSRAVGEQLLTENDYLGTADHLRHCYATEHRMATYQQIIRDAVSGPLDDPFVPSSLYTTLLSLGPTTVFTTNYDKLFEVASAGGYATHTYKSSTLVDDLRRAEPVLVKLHGSTDSMTEIVLTRSDYARVHQVGARVLELLRALALTQTFLFVGYSLNDPDIQLVLQNLGHSRLSPEAHFMLSEQPDSPAKVPVFQECFGVSVLTYPTGDHAMAESRLEDLVAEVTGQRAALSP